MEPEVVVHHMESDRESNAIEHPTEPDKLTTVVDPSDLLLRANRFSPLSAEIDDEPLPPIEVPALRRRLALVGVTRKNRDGECDTDGLEFPEPSGRPSGQFLRCPVSPHIEHWPFLPRNFRQFWADPTFSVVRSTFWAKEEAQHVEFFTTRNFGHLGPLPGHPFDLPKCL